MNSKNSSLTVFWFGFVGSIFIYVFIGYQKVLQENRLVFFEYGDIFDKIFIGLIFLSLIFLTVTHFFLPSFLLTASDEKKISIKLLQFAFSDAIALIGLILFFSNGSFLQLIILSAIALLSFFRLFPRN